MKLPKITDPHSLWHAVFTLSYMIIACVAGAFWGVTSFLAVVLVGSIVDFFWRLRLGLRRWNPEVEPSPNKDAGGTPTPQ